MSQLRMIWYYASEIIIELFRSISLHPGIVAIFAAVAIGIFIYKKVKSFLWIGVSLIFLGYGTQLIAVAKSIIALFIRR